LQTVEEIVADDDDVGATCRPTFAGGNRFDTGSRDGQGRINTCGKYYDMEKLVKDHQTKFSSNKASLGTNDAILHQLKLIQKILVKN
jgi:hypothetical protein